PPAPPAGPAKKPPADPPANGLPTPDWVLARYVRALGGEPALRKITSRSMRGTFEIPSRQITGEAEIDTASPDRFYSLLKISDAQQYIQAFDGKAGWSYDPQSGYTDLAGKELAQMRRGAQFEYELHFRELFPQLRIIEKATEENHPAWVVEATPPGEGPEKFYFDVETGLLLRHDSFQDTPDGEVAVVHRYSEYVAVDGVQVPTLLRHTDPAITWQVKFTDVHNNVPMDLAVFSKPAPQ
ncbi:MAG TPA: hypothetical protein VKG84_06585, partial [Candidatus Acidoferrales bacterium]|nr:hypothetical protein [Candidatus Acidoferrales bacterium]